MAFSASLYFDQTEERKLLIEPREDYLTSDVLMKRPGGYGESSLLEKNPMYYKYKSKKGYLYGSLIALPFFIIGIIPLLFAFTNFPSSFSFKNVVGCKKKTSATLS
jgi:hypothetical protein